MKKIIALTEQQFLSYITETEERYSVIYIYDDSERKSIVSFERTENFIEIINVAFDNDDDECEENIEFSFNTAEKIIRFCERQRDADTVIITCDGNLTRAYNVKSALEECYRLNSEPYEFSEMCTVQKMIKLKFQESRNWLINVLSPMDYCRRIAEYTVNQLYEYISGTNMEEFNSCKFLWNRECSIYLKNGTYFSWDIEILDSCFGNTVIPDTDDIEYIVFKGVPEFATRDSFYDDMDYIFDDHFGIINEYDNRFCYDSIHGIIPTKEYELPEKYKNYRLIQREWHEFPYDKNRVWYPPVMEQVLEGIIRAEEYLSVKTGYKPQFKDVPLSDVDKHSFYSEEYPNVLDMVLNKMERAGMAALSELEYMCAYAAHIYIGMLCQCGHCENISLVKAVFSEVFKGNALLPEFGKLWKTVNSPPEISNNPIDMLCIAVYSLIETVRPLSGCRPIPAKTFDDCLCMAFEFTKGYPELNNAIILTDAFAGVYCQITENVPIDGSTDV